MFTCSSKNKKLTNKALKHLIGPLMKHKRNHFICVNGKLILNEIILKSIYVALNKAD